MPTPQELASAQVLKSRLFRAPNSRFTPPQPYGGETDAVAPDQTGAEVSPTLASEAPDLLLPSAITAGGTDQRAALEKLHNYFGTRSPEFQADQERVANFTKERNDAMNERDPVIRDARDKAFAEKLQAEGEPARVAAQGQLAVQESKNRGELNLQSSNRRGTEQLLQAMGSQGGTAGMGGAGATKFKPSINTKGEVAFTSSTMPAIVQRSHDQLLDARAKTEAALGEAERLYPGITEEATKADTGQTQGQGWFSTLTGMGAAKYGSALDFAKARNERLKYDMGVPTPYSNLAQEASFGNIEQMAGQLPGVRGVQGLLPLFKEHQSRWGHETPLATVQRLKHMHALMGQTLEEIESGAGVSQGQQ